jgi:hypothetical protein
VKNKTKIEQFHKLMNTYTVKHKKYARNEYSPSTVKSYISGLSYRMKISGLLDTTNSFIIKKMLLGMQRLHKMVDSRRPITIDLLLPYQLIYRNIVTYASLTNEIQQIHQLVKMQKRQVKNKTRFVLYTRY